MHAMSAYSLLLLLLLPPPPPPPPLQAKDSSRCRKR
jgi:hypothetical protein